MIDPITASEQLLFTTVRVETRNSRDEVRVGTASFSSFQSGKDALYPQLLRTTMSFVMPLKGFYLHESELVDSKRRPSGSIFQAIFDNFIGRWIPHPKPAIDLCAMLFEPIKEQCEKQGKTVFHKTLPSDWIKPDSDLEDLSAVEEVLMVGYPIGLWDEVNNLPLMRRGITAVHSGVDFQRKSLGVIDAACFPGSSGSPVVILNESQYYSKRGTIFGRRAILLGILVSVPFRNSKGKIEIREIPTVIEQISITPTMIHLGYYINAKEILELRQHIVEKLTVEGKL